MTTLAEIEAKLKNLGHKQSKIRTSILKILELTGQPVTVQDILEKLSNQNLNTSEIPLPNKTTVYRELEILTCNNMVREISLGENKKRYELDTSHHHHLVCTSCDKIQCFDAQENFEGLEKNLEAKLNFKIQYHILEFFGICNKCLQAV